MANSIWITLVCGTSILAPLITLGGESKVIQGQVVNSSGQGIVASLYLDSIYTKDRRTLTILSASSAAPAIVKQKHKQFEPRVSKGNAFDLGLFKRGEKYDEQKRTRLDQQDSRFEEVQFNGLGKVNVFCNIHPSMSALVVVVDHDHFATSDTEDYFKIPLPHGTGKFQIHAIDEAGTEVVQSVDTNLVIKIVSQNQTLAPEHLNKQGKPYQADPDSKYE